VKLYDIEQRRLIDAEITRRSIAFMERQSQAKKPFFAYATLTQPHLPTLPNPAFAGKTGNGDWAICSPRWITMSARCSMPLTGSASATTPS